MKSYKICDLIVNMDLKYSMIKDRAEKYLISDSNSPDITIESNDENITRIKDLAPYLNNAECEVIYTTSMFYRRLLSFDGFMLHSSAVCVDNKAYLFSANSGTGKSTHTTQWLKLFGDKAYIINDDKPALKVEDGKVYVYGTPWSGKSDLNLNVRVPLQGICVLERSENNFIEPLDKGVAVYKLMNQTLRPPFESYMDKLLNLLDVVITETPIWRMGCNISTEAAQIAYDAMSK
ncbi:MAG: hypothetical protein K2F81_03295 [Ruminococcus sp.]|nr:hypothetical protein [Ruminococcus sp.]